MTKKSELRTFHDFRWLTFNSKFSFDTDGFKSFLFVSNENFELKFSDMIHLSLT